MICPNCGCECDDNAMFCRKCGTKINSFHSDITQTSIDKIDNTEEDIFAGIKIESGREGYSENENKKSSYKIQKLDDEVEEDLEGFDDSYISHSKQHNYKSASHNYSSSNKVKKNTTKKNISKKKAPKKKMSKKKVLGLIVLIIVLMAATSVGTLAVKKSIMTGKFDKYYNIGEKYYKEENYEYAKSQYILASSNAFTKEQKIKAYEKVCQVDEILGKYDEEEMKYLEYLIDVDNQNIDYYKKLKPDWQQIPEIFYGISLALLQMEDNEGLDHFIEYSKGFPKNKFIDDVISIIDLQRKPECNRELEAKLKACEKYLQHQGDAEGLIFVYEQLIQYYETRSIVKQVKYLKKLNELNKRGMQYEQ